MHLESCTKSRYSNISWLFKEAFLKTGQQKAQVILRFLSRMILSVTGLSSALQGNSHSWALHWRTVESLLLITKVSLGVINCREKRREPLHTKIPWAKVISGLLNYLNYNLNIYHILYHTAMKLFIYVFLSFIISYDW